MDEEKNCQECPKALYFSTNKLVTQNRSQISDNCFFSSGQVMLHKSIFFRQKFPYFGDLNNTANIFWSHYLIILMSNSHVSPFISVYTIAMKQEEYRANFSSWILTSATQIFKSFAASIGLVHM